MKSFNAGDAAGASLVYDPDGYFMPNGRAPVKGRGGIEEYFKSDMTDGVQTAQVRTVWLLKQKVTDRGAQKH